MADEIVAARFCVYVHSRMSTGEPFYVGKGRVKRAHSSYGRSEYWRRIVAKDGGRYINYVAKGLHEDAAFQVEREWIDKYRSMGVRLANITDGGEGSSGNKLTPEHRAKLRSIMLGHRLNVGRKHSPETILKMSISAKARVSPKHTEEHKRKISEGLLRPEVREKLRLASLGKKASAETRAKLSAFQKGKQHTLGHKLTDDHKAKVSAGLRAFYAKRRAEK